MTTIPLPLTDRRIVWLPVALAERLRLEPAGYTGLEADHPGEVPVEASRLPVPKACPGFVAMPPVVALPSGAADRARRALGRSGAWPVPRPGALCEECGEEECEVRE